MEIELYAAIPYIYIYSTTQKSISPSIWHPAHMVVSFGKSLDPQKMNKIYPRISKILQEPKPYTDSLPGKPSTYLFFRQLWLVLGVKLMEITATCFPGVYNYRISFWFFASITLKDHPPRSRRSCWRKAREECPRVPGFFSWTPSTKGKKNVAPNKNYSSTLSTGH